MRKLSIKYVTHFPIHLLTFIEQLRQDNLLSKEKEIISPGIK